jgi:hypothetical protein
MGESPQTADAKQESATTPAALRQLQEMPRDELEHLAEDIGIDPTAQRSIQHLVAAIHERRQMIEAMDRQAMFEVVRWGRRAVAANATRQQLAMEIAKIKSMRFAGLSVRGLLVLAVMRGVNLKGGENESDLIFKLKRQEGFFKRLARKRRAWLGSIVSNMLGGESGQDDYQYLPPQPGAGSTQATSNPPSSSGSIQEEIEESGLFGGLASRVKRQADSYLNQKLDEIEARIDRKLDEIDRRLADWRDKEIANRIRILKITLWVSVIVAAVSLIYLYIKEYLPKLFA